jgi:hypothetical protein
VDDVSGLVFDIEPITTSGGPAPSATSAALNPVRVAELLLGLVAPVNGVQSLTGDNVTLSRTDLSVTPSVGALPRRSPHE